MSQVLDVASTIRKIEIERLGVTTSKPFDVVAAALEAAIGRPDMVEFFKATNSAWTFADLESSVHSGLGRTGLMMFMKLDHGAILRKETGLDTTTGKLEPDEKGIC